MGDANGIEKEAQVGATYGTITHSIKNEANFNNGRRRTISTNGFQYKPNDKEDSNTKLLSDESVESGEAEIENNTSPSRLFCGYSKRQARVGATLAILSVTDVLGFSIFAPFFPVIAEEKHLTQIEIGIIFAAYSMAGIFGSIAGGTLLVRIGPKFMIMSGTFVYAGTTFCFAILKWSPAQYFFILCLICRLLMGFGSSLSYTALFAIIFQEFTDKSLTVIGMSESLCSIGGIIGPLIGGSLYALGGYTLPFFVLGSILFSEIVLTFFLIPTVAVQPDAAAISPMRLLLNIHGIFGSLFVVVSFVINSFIVSNLSVYLINSYGISPFMVGIYMLTFSIFYGIGTTLFGYIADAKKCGAHLMAASGIICGVAMAFYGPADFVQDLFGWSGPQQWFSYVMNGVMGACMGALIMPTFGEMLEAASQMKLHDNKLAQYGLVSGLWNTMFSIGDIMGPTIGGVMVEKSNFQNSCVYIGIVITIVGILKIVHLVILSRSKRKLENTEEKSEVEPLLGKENPSLQV